MKKVIATIATSLGLAFCIALANAQTSDSTTPSQDSAAGTVTEPTSVCTDSNGILYRRGQTGFEQCLAEVKALNPKSPVYPPSDTPSEAGEAGAEGSGTNSDTPTDVDMTPPSTGQSPNSPQTP